MNQKYVFFIFIFFQSIYLFAQVGINNTTPTATLDVTGEVLVQNKLYLENPGKYTEDPDSKLLMISDADGSKIKYDVSNSTFGPLNYVEFAFNDVSNFGLDGGYNTQIDVNKYTLAVQGYYFNLNGDTNISFKSTNTTNPVEGQQFYAYKQNGTWWLNASVNNSRFYVGENLAQSVDIYMEVIVYRNNFITKVFDTPQQVDMGAAATKTVPLPAGF
ncbi:hypothetical protein ACFQ3R_09175 [Mesonia ostreae]|uniref:Uncharacterized protein n=1 Tax=Mesonia ostreae TaxID=861110 RepID=A0ABU2KEM1_9FLAO|nr:hypothetical protein [Mesonia ostreae]MDT0293161.1 hypothetical protein [Mesonia ostreae]